MRYFVVPIIVSGVRVVVGDCQTTQKSLNRFRLPTSFFFVIVFEEKLFVPWLLSLSIVFIHRRSINSTHNVYQNQQSYIGCLVYVFRHINDFFCAHCLWRTYYYCCLCVPFTTNVHASTYCTVLKIMNNWPPSPI